MATNLQMEPVKQPRSFPLTQFLEYWSESAEILSFDAAAGY